MEISLASAFRYRNKIKKKILKLQGAVEYCKVAVDPDDVEIKKGNFETKNYDDDVALTLRLMDLLNHVNKNIGLANKGADHILNDIQTLNAKIAMLKEIHRNICDTSLYVLEKNTVTGNSIKRPLAALYKKTWYNELQQCRQQLNNCEEKLSAYNATTTVSFDVPEDLAPVVETA